MVMLYKNYGGGGAALAEGGKTREMEGRRETSACPWHTPYPHIIHIHNI